MYIATVYAPWYGPIKSPKWLQRSVLNGERVLWVIPSDQPQCVSGVNVLWLPDTLEDLNARLQASHGVTRRIDHGYHACLVREAAREVWPISLSTGLWGWSDWDTESRLDAYLTGLHPMLLGAAHAFGMTDGMHQGPLLLAPSDYVSDGTWVDAVNSGMKAVDEQHTARRIFRQCTTVVAQLSLYGGGPYAWHRPERKAG